MKLGLYSISYLGIWYRDGALALSEVFERAKTLGYDAVEIDGKRPHGNPMDVDAKARREIRTIASDHGIGIPAVAANNDFSNPVVEHRECELLMVRELIRLAHDLGSPVLRVFLAWPGVTYRDGLADYDIARRRWEENWRDTTRQEMWLSALTLFREAAWIAENEGVTLALQNHGPVIRHYKDVLDMVDEVASPAFQVCLDAPLLADQDPQAVRQAVHDVGKRQVHSHFFGEFSRDSDGIVVQRLLRYGDLPVNYPDFLGALGETGYEGYLCYEFCHLALDTRHEIQGIAYVDEQAGLAAEYMRQLLL
jgi:sugar phosphate isomerase/epimerase